MKTIFTTIFALLFLSIDCIAQDSLYIYKSGATGEIRALADIDSITFYNSGTLVTDIEGNFYKTVKIGNQTWMAENLKTRQFNDGIAIPLVEDFEAWEALDSPAYCWYNNDSATYNATYGALYNWYTVNTGKLCPVGWHVPTDADWTVLTNYLGGNSIAGGKIKEAGLTHWFSNAMATNKSGFTGLPSGYRYYYGTFYIIGYAGSWWSSTESNTSFAWYRVVFYWDGSVSSGSDYKLDGISVRCLKDE